MILAKLGVVPQQIADRRHLPLAREGHDRRRGVDRSLRRREARAAQGREVLLLPRLVGRQRAWSRCSSTPKRWEALPQAYKEALECACDEQTLLMMAKYDAKNPEALRRLVGGGVAAAPFPKPVLDACYKATQEIFDELSAKSADFKKIYDVLEQVPRRLEPLVPRRRAHLDSYRYSQGVGAGANEAVSEAQARPGHRRAGAAQGRRAPPARPRHLRVRHDPARPARGGVPALAGGARAASRASRKPAGTRGPRLLPRRPAGREGDRRAFDAADLQALRAAPARARQGALRRRADRHVRRAARAPKPRTSPSRSSSTSRSCRRSSTRTRRALDKSVRVHEEWDDNLYPHALARQRLRGRVEEGRRGGQARDRRSRASRWSRWKARARSRSGTTAPTSWSSTARPQTPHLMRIGIARFLGIPEEKVRVIAPDVGGGFGYKCIVLPGRPVRRLARAQVPQALPLHRGPPRAPRRRRQLAPAPLQPHRLREQGRAACSRSTPR